MCGICGIYGKEALNPALLHGMTDTIIHRGPDDDGYFVDGGIGLGMRRLSIVDVARGKQPIANEDGQVVVVFNGEIYNYPELRQDLMVRRHQFRTDSDTECIVHLYEEFGLEFVSHLRGMFGIALYDSKVHRLVLARDRLGKKPLYYVHLKGKLLFGSEIKPILYAMPDLRRMDERMLYPYFRFGFVPEPQTIYPDICQVPAGCLLVFDGNTPVISRYWDLRFVNVDNPIQHRSVNKCTDELDNLLEEAVRIRLMSEVPLGAFLSGGLDSSLIVAYMSCLLKQPVKTFTVSFEESEFDELKDALRVAEHCGTEHHVKELRIEDLRKVFFASIDMIVQHTDQPFGDSSALPTYYISRLASEELKVILGGDGADEVFGGYNHYRSLRFAQIYQRLPECFRQGIIAPLGKKWVDTYPPGPARWHANRWQIRIADSNLPLPAMLANKYATTGVTSLNQLMPEIFSMLSSGERDGVSMIPLGTSGNPFEQLQYADLMFHQL